MIQIILKCTFFAQKVSKACWIAKQTSIDFWNWKYSDLEWTIQEFKCIYRDLNQTKRKMIIFHPKSAHIWKFHEKFETWWLEVKPCFFEIEKFLSYCLQSSLKGFYKMIHSHPQVFIFEVWKKHSERKRSGDVDQKYFEDLGLVEPWHFWQWVFSSWLLWLHFILTCTKSIKRLLKI